MPGTRRACPGAPRTGREKIAGATAAAGAVGGGVNGVLDEMIDALVGREDGILFVGEQLVEGLARDAGALCDRENRGVGVALSSDDIGRGENDSPSLRGADLLA
jgi:hypothetical protein